MEPAQPWAGSSSCHLAWSARQRRPRPRLSPGPALASDATDCGWTSLSVPATRLQSRATCIRVCAHPRGLCRPHLQTIWHDRGRCPSRRPQACRWRSSSLGLGLGLQRKRQRTARRPRQQQQGHPAPMSWSRAPGGRGPRRQGGRPFGSHAFASDASGCAPRRPCALAADLQLLATVSPAS